ncbi:hypothetical protein BU17DRAFT_59563 [Hysterangium stoloniferum]|nr:hypothetical protein BU17DRAFT_59563 [Hysterangium stoloniferum]
MHLFFENICPLLRDHWIGARKFKDKPPADPGYRLAPHIWEDIGHETADAYKIIPSDFVGAMPDITKSKYKAEYWSFWIIYLAPALLHGRFPNDRYYKHLLLLIKIIKKCIQFKITSQELEELRQSIIQWVEQYERLYYKYNEGNLPACTFNVHAMLHIADYIKQAGPVWTTWAFPMERYCGKLGERITSRLHPYATLSHFVKRTAQLSQLKVRYSRVWTHLSICVVDNQLAKYEVIFDGYEDYVLRPPRHLGYIPEPIVMRKIAQYFAAVYQCSHTRISTLLPYSMVRWGKVRIQNAGDKIWTSSAVSGEQAANVRDSSFVCYELLVKNNHRSKKKSEPTEIQQVFYGQIHYIISLKLSSCAELNIPDTPCSLLARISPCITNGKDATESLTSYNRTSTEIFIDLRTINCVVGRVQRGRDWYIIDRSGGIARTVFIEPNLDEE